MDSNDLDLNDISLLSSDPATLSLLERAISRRHAAAQLELGWLNDCLHSRLATIRDASEFSAPFPEINTQSEVPEVIKQINEMMASLREKVPDQSAGAVLVSNRVAKAQDKARTILDRLSPSGDRTALRELSEACLERTNELNSNHQYQDTEIDEPVMKPPKRQPHRTRKCQYKGFGADLALELCWKAISERPPDQYGDQTTMSQSSNLVKAKVGRDLLMYNIQ